MELSIERACSCYEALTIDVHCRENDAVEGGNGWEE
jgi:hypothetical protein